MVSYRDVQHLRKKTVKRTKKRTGSGTRRYRKGSPSKTRPGRKDFVTHKGSKFYDRAGHRYTYALGKSISSLPYTIFGIKSTKKTRKSRKGGKSRKSRKSHKGGKAVFKPVFGNEYPSLGSTY